MSKLVIVESPAKAKTIGKYLGDGYEVTASMGHIRDLPASQLGIDVDHGYAPQYINIKGKEKLIKELKAEAKKADEVFLATDPDREGEAISWHLAYLLGLPVDATELAVFADDFLDPKLRHHKPTDAESDGEKRNAPWAALATRLHAALRPAADEADGRLLDSPRLARLTANLRREAAAMAHASPSGVRP